MTTQLTHWKKTVNPDYIGSYALPPGEDLVLTIKSAGVETITGTNGKKEEKLVIHFAEGEKPMICNRTNAKVISRIHKTPYIEQWSGKQVQLYSSRVSAFGEEVDAIRVRDFIPKVAEVDYESAVSALEGCTSLAQLKAIYSALSKPQQGHPMVVAAKDKMKGALQG